MTLNTNFKTYKEWLSLGYCVKKGEKSLARNEDGVATFSDSQVLSFPKIIRENIVYPLNYDVMRQIEVQTVALGGFVMDDLEKFIVDGDLDTVMNGDDPSDEDHWVNMRPY